MMKTRLVMRYSRRYSSTRQLSTETATATASKYRPYPFSKSVQSQSSPTEYIPNDNRFLTRTRLKNDYNPPTTTQLRKGIALMPYLSRTLPHQRSHHLLSTYFAKSGKGRITPGTVLTVTLSQAPFTFSGVLISIRRKGPDSNILLRNVVRKIGVEMRVYLASPTLLAIKVVQRAGGTKLNEPSVKKRLGKTTSKRRKGKSTSDSARLLDPKTARGWKIGTPGPVPTMRVAREAGIIRDRRKRKNNNNQDGDTPPAVSVDEKDAVMGKHMHRAKLYFLRDYPSRMSAISAGIMKRDS